MIGARAIRAMGATTVTIAFAAASLNPLSAMAQGLTTSDLVPMAAAGSSAEALPLLFVGKKKKKKKKSSTPSGLTPESAETKRQAIRDSVSSARQSGDLEKVADEMESNAALLGDPVTFIESADARLELADKERSIEQAEKAMETTHVALDILHFYSDVAAGNAQSDWLVIAPSDADSLISQAENQITRAEELIEAIEKEEEESVDAPVAAAGAEKKKKKKKRSKAGPGTGLIAGGSALIVLGVAGGGLGIAGVAISASKQSEVEKLDPMMDQEEIDRLDDEGKRANLMGYLGLGTAVVGLAVGVPLLAIGLKRRKEGRSPPANASLRVAPALSRGEAGLVLTGRF